MKKRLIEFVSYLDISVRAFEELCGLGRNNINNMKDDSEIGSDKLSKIIEKYPQLNAYWLLTGKGNMLNNDDDKISKIEKSIVNSNNNTIAVSEAAHYQQIINSQQEQIKFQQEQMSELISIIKTLKIK